MFVQQRSCVDLRPTQTGNVRWGRLGILCLLFAVVFRVVWMQYMVIRSKFLFVWMFVQVKEKGLCLALFAKWQQSQVEKGKA